MTGKAIDPQTWTEGRVGQEVFLFKNQPGMIFGFYWVLFGFYGFLGFLKIFICIFHDFLIVLLYKSYCIGSYKLS